MTTKSAKHLAESTIRKHIIDVEMGWAFDNMTYGAYSCGTDDDGWSLEICDTDHPEHGRVYILGEIAPNASDSLSGVVVDSWLGERINSVEDWIAVNRI